MMHPLQLPPPRFDESRVVISGPGPGPGNWAGAATATRVDDIVYLAYRVWYAALRGREFSGGGGAG